MHKKITRSFVSILAIPIISLFGSDTANGAVVINFADQGATIGVNWSGSGNTVGTVGTVINLDFPSGTLLQPAFTPDLVPSPNTMTLGGAFTVTDFTFVGPGDSIEIELGSSLGNGVAYNATGSAVINQSFSSIFSTYGSFTATNDGPDFGTTTVNVIPEPSPIWFGLVGCTIVSMFSFLRRRGLIAAKLD